MKAIVFNGESFAAVKEKSLKERVKTLGFIPKLVSVFFKEDSTGILYTRLKQELAERVGIHFHPEELSYEVPAETAKKVVAHYSNDEHVQGVMIQKPKLSAVASAPDVGHLGYAEWWELLTQEINPAKDVDCLTRTNLASVYGGNYKIVPATVRSVLSILNEAVFDVAGMKVAVIGRSELVGKPLAYVLTQRGADVYLCGSNGLAARSVGGKMTENIKPMEIAEVAGECGVVISATGRGGIIRAPMIKDGSVVIDVGEPVGDVDFGRVIEKASFITPVPKGVGPVTVVSLMENLVDVIEKLQK